MKGRRRSQGQAMKLLQDDMKQDDRDDPELAMKRNDLAYLEQYGTASGQP